MVKRPRPAPAAAAGALLLQPELEHRFLAGLGKFSKVLLHAGLDPALAGGTWLQNRLISGLHAPKIALAAGFTCAAAVDAVSSRIAPDSTNLFDMMVSPLCHCLTMNRRWGTGGSGVGDGYRLSWAFL
jgi:hypothetical protein